MSLLATISQDFAQQHDGVILEPFFSQNKLLFSTSISNITASTRTVGVVQQVIYFEGIGETIVDEQLIKLGNTFLRFDNTLGEYKLKFFPATWLRDLTLNINTVPSVLTPYDPDAPIIPAGESKENPAIFELLEIGDTLTYPNIGNLGNVWVKVTNTNRYGFKVDSEPVLTIGKEDVDGIAIDDTSGFTEFYLNVPCGGSDFTLTFNTLEMTQGNAREYPFTVNINSLPTSQTIDITGLSVCWVRINNPSLLPITITSDAGGFDLVAFDGQSVITDTAGLTSFYGVFYSFASDSLTINLA